MLRVFLRLALPALILMSAYAPPALGAAEARRAECGEYSFELPNNFELRNREINSLEFVKNLELNHPFEQKVLLTATVTCLREKKTSQHNFALPAKEKIELLTGPRRDAVQLLISATENYRRSNIWIKFSLLEEHSANARVINGRERFLVAIEMDAEHEDWHTMLFVSDFSKFDGFFNADEYRAHITGTAALLMESVRSLHP